MKYFLVLLASFVSSVTPGFASVQNYKGTYLLNKEATAHNFCLVLSEEVIDQFKGDPDMEGKGFDYQKILLMRQGTQTCESELNHNGDEIGTCSELKLDSALPLKDLNDKKKTHGIVMKTSFRDGASESRSVGSFVLKATDEDCR